MNKHTLGDVKKLAANDVVIMNYLRFYEMGQLTLEDALIGMVCDLEEQKNIYERTAIETLERSQYSVYVDDTFKMDDDEV